MSVKLACVTSGLFDFEGSDVDETTTILANGEDHVTVYESVEGVVAADAHIYTGMVNCAALAFDDVTCFGKLSAKDFDAETLAF